MSTFMIEQLVRQHQEELRADARRHGLVRRRAVRGPMAPVMPLPRRSLPIDQREDSERIAS
jgi:hypothetical protein